MNRRQFLTSSAAVAGVGLITIPETGCFNAATVAALADVLGNAGANIASLEGNTQLAAALTADTAAAVAAIKNWKSGTPTNDVIEAIGLVQSDLSLIPISSKYVSYIDLALSTVQLILAMIPAPSAAGTKVSARHVRFVHLSEPAPKTAAEFKSRWNAIAAGAPDSAKAEIK